MAVGFSSFFFHPTTTNVIKLFYVLVAAAVPTFGSSQENLTFNFFFLRCCSHFPPKLKLRKLFLKFLNKSNSIYMCFETSFYCKTFRKKIPLASSSLKRNSLVLTSFSVIEFRSVVTKRNGNNSKQRRCQIELFNFLGIYRWKRKRIILSASFDSGKRQRSLSGLVVN